MNKRCIAEPQSPHTEVVMPRLSYRTAKSVQELILVFIDLTRVDHETNQIPTEAPPNGNFLLFQKSLTMRSSSAAMMQHYGSRSGMNSASALQPPPRVIPSGPEPNQQLQGGTFTYKSPYEER